MPSFTHGKQAEVYLAGLDLTPYGRTVTISRDIDTAEASTFADDDKVYVVGMEDGTATTEILVDATADGTIAATCGAGTKVAWSYYPMGAAAGLTGYGMLADTTSHEVTAEVGDVVQASVEIQSSVGAELIVSHHPLAQRTASGTATVIDNAAATSGGGRGYLHATAVSGTVTVTVQDSADNVTYADLLVLGTLTAPGGARGTVSGTVRRYTRLVYTATAGTATFVAGFGRG